MKFKEWLYLSERIVYQGQEFRDPLTALRNVYSTHAKPDSLVVTYTAIDKVGINPRSTYDTPIGIYFYPLDYVISKRMQVPFAGDQPFINVCEFTRPNRILHMHPATSQQKGMDVLDHLFTREEIESASQKNQEFELRSDYSKLWLTTMNLAGSNPVRWNAILRKCGIDGFVDHNTGTIHANEPIQGVVFGSSALRKILVIDLKKNVGTSSSLNSIIARGDFDTARRLIDGGARVSDEFVITAIKNGHLDIIKYLVHDKKADKILTVGDTPVRSAVASGNLDIVKYLVDEKGATIKGGAIEHSVIDAIKSKHFDIAEYLAGKLIDQGQDVTPSFDAALLSGDIGLVKYFVRKLEPTILQYKDGPNAERVVERAAEGGSLDIVRYLVDEKGLDPGFYSVFQAARHGKIDVVRYLMGDKGAKVVPWVLKTAAEEGRFDVVKYLTGGEVKDSQGKTFRIPHGREIKVTDDDIGASASKEINDYLAKKKQEQSPASPSKI